MTVAETGALARSGAVAGLCPETEANLGDGLFDGPRYLAEGGRFGIGSDSHIHIGLAEELRLLEYGQRLSSRGRNILCAPGAGTGESLFRAAVSGGARALGQPVDGLQAGQRADFVVLTKPTLPCRAGRSSGLSTPGSSQATDPACATSMSLAAASSPTGTMSPATV